MESSRSRELRRLPVTPDLFFQLSIFMYLDQALCRDLGTTLGFAALKMLFRERFGRLLEANLAPTWGQVGAQVGAKLRSKSPSKLVNFLTLYLKGICSILGSILEGFEVRKWSPKANLR